MAQRIYTGTSQIRVKSLQEIGALNVPSKITIFEEDTWWVFVPVFNPSLTIIEDLDYPLNVRLNTQKNMPVLNPNHGGSTYFGTKEANFHNFHWPNLPEVRGIEWRYRRLDGYTGSYQVDAMYYRTSLSGG